MSLTAVLQRWVSTTVLSSVLILIMGSDDGIALNAQLQATIIRVEADPAGVTAQSVIEAALNRAAQVRKQNPDRQVIVELAAGHYRLERPLVVGPEHAGRPGAPLVIRGAGDVRVSGSVELQPRSPSASDQSLLSRLPMAARGHVAFFSLPRDSLVAGHALIPRAENFHTSVVPFEIFDSSGPLELAYWPNGAWARTRSANPHSFVLDTSPPDAWRLEPDLWATGAFWSHETLRITYIDPATGRLRLNPPSPLGIADDAPVRIVHALSELDLPGEWYRARDLATLVVWPRTPGPIRISVAQNLLVLQGTHDVEIQSLTFQESRGDGIVVSKSDRVVVKDCTIRMVAGRAVFISGGNASGVIHTTIEDAGDGGVYLVGGNRQTLKAGGLYVRNSVIRRFQRLTKSYRGAVHLDGAGNEATGNVISDAAHYGIRFQGNDHLIEMNEISRVVTESSDMGAVYTGGDWSARGTHVVHNVIYRIGTTSPKQDTKGVYLDDGASGITVSGNIFIDTMRPVFLGGGHDNIVEGNIFLDSTPGIHLDGRGLTWGRAAMQDRTHEIWKRLFNVPFRSPEWRRRYPTLVDIDATDPGVPKRNIIRNNTSNSPELLETLPEVSLGLQTISGNVSHNFYLNTVRDVNLSFGQSKEIAAFVARGDSSIPWSKMRLISSNAGRRYE